jgi:hypothetical protein
MAGTFSVDRDLSVVLAGLTVANASDRKAEGEHTWCIES